MNVKTAHRGYPKDDLLAEVGEVKGNTPEAKKLRAEKRGKQAAFTQEFTVAGGQKVTVLAAGHNKKLPLLLVGTHSSMLPGTEHKKVWQAPQADGTMQWYSRVTPQTQIHSLYRENMNVVDLHNKLRQGVVSMADVWQTSSWVERHFAEGLGLWEVNVFKALTFFQKRRWEGISHNTFRMRLAHAFMTLGKVPYPADAPEAAAGRADGTPRGHPSSMFSPPNLSSCPPPDSLDPNVVCLGQHRWVPCEKKTCSYCGKRCVRICETCAASGVGMFYACMRTSTNRDCMAQHVSGAAPKHFSFSRQKKRPRPDGSLETESSSDLFSGGSESDSQPRPRESPNSAAQRSARARAAAQSSSSSTN